jgi:peptidyl-prolyl cis-trans isomerase B (cyclophilin B)
MKKLLIVIMILSIGLLGAQSSFAQQPTKKFTPREIKRMAATRAIIETKFGNMTLRFFPDVAPGHVKNFIDLAGNGFYNGTIFHRVIPGFMIQGGDPISKDPTRRNEYGRGGPGYTINAEFNNRPHKRGALSMARMNDPNSAGSQFFICFQMDPRQQAVLDGHYTVFGVVVSGMEVADKIASLPRDPRDNPNERVEIKVKILKGK